MRSTNSFPGLRLSAVLAFVAILAAAQVSAAPVYWDPLGDQSGSGGAGIWDDTTLQWWDGVAAVDDPWNTLPVGTVASFGGTGGLVNVSGAKAAGGLIFTVNGYTIGAAGDGTLSLGSAGIDASAATGGNTAVGTAVVLTAGQIWKASNTAGDALNITNTVNLGGNNLTLDGVGNVTLSNTVSTGGAGATITLSGGGNRTISGGVTIGAADSITIDGGNSGSINGVISGGAVGAVGLRKLGAGTLTLGNAGNTYLGQTTIGGGVLSISAAGNLSAAQINIGGATATLRSTGANVDLLATRLLNVTAGGGTLDVPTLGTNLTVSGTITSASPDVLTKYGLGTLTLTGANVAFAGGLNVAGGLVVVTADGQLGVAANPVTLNGGGLRAATLTPNALRVFTIGAGNGTFDATTALTSISFTANNQIIGAGTLYKTGAGVLALTVQNATFGGSAVVNAGVLELRHLNALAARPITVNGSSELSFYGLTAQTWLDNVTMNGGTISANGGDLANLGGNLSALAAFNVGLKDYYASAATNARSFTISGNLSGGGAMTINSPPAAKTLTLSGANNTGYWGLITIPDRATVVITRSMPSVAGGFPGFNATGGTATLTINAPNPTFARASVGVPGLNGTYYNLGFNNTTTTAFTNWATDLLIPFGRFATRVDTAINIPNSASGSYPIVPVPGFHLQAANAADGAMWKGVLNVVNAGTYTFNSSSDDGSMLYIDGSAVVSNDGPHGIPGATPTGTVTLGAGPHSIVSKWTNGSGGGGVTVQYSGADTGNVLRFFNDPLIVGGAGVDTGSMTPTNIGNVNIASGTLAMNITVDSITPSLTMATGTTFTLNSQTVSTLSITATSLGGGTATLGAQSGVMSFGPITETAATAVTVNGPYLTVFTGVNTYTGLTTVNAGELDLAAQGVSIPANLTLSAAAGTFVNRVKLLANEQIFDGATVTVTRGEFDIGNFNETINSLVLNGANLHDAVVTGTRGTLTVNNIGVLLSSGVISANLAGNAAGAPVVKAGPGTLLLAGNNTYVGQTQVNSGVLRIASNNALGAAVLPGDDTVVAAGAALEIVGRINVGETIGISGSGLSYDGGFTFTGALRNLGGRNIINPTVTLNANSIIQSDGGNLILANPNVSVNGFAANASLTIQGAGEVNLASAPILGAGGLTKAGTGTLTFSYPLFADPLTVFAAPPTGVLGFFGPQSFFSVIPVGMGYKFYTDPGPLTTIVAPAGTTVIGAYPIDNVFLSRVSFGSQGTIALAVDNSNPLDFLVNGLNGSLGAVGTATYSGPLIPLGSYKLGGGGGKLKVTSLLSGPNSLDVYGDVELPYAHTFTGGVNINRGGLLTVVNNTGLGDASNVVTLNDGGTLRLINSNRGSTDNLFFQIGNPLPSGLNRRINVVQGTIDSPVTARLDIPSASANWSGVDSAALTAVNGLTGGNQYSTLVKTGLGYLYMLNSNDYAGNLVLRNSNVVELRASGALPNVLPHHWLRVLFQRRQRCRPEQPAVADRRERDPVQRLCADHAHRRAIAVPQPQRRHLGGRQEQ
jgi:autotransporter-associated beta strand protein